MNISKAFEPLHLDDDLFVWDHYDGSSAYDFEELYLGHLKTYNKFYHEKKEIWYVHPLMSGSDYGGDTVHRSNYLEMKSYVKRSKYIKEVYGGHGSYGIAFNVSKLKGKFALELVDIFKQLKNYPLVDDEAMSDLETELENEYWESDLKEEFCKEIEKSLQSIGFTVEVDRDSERLWEAYRILMDKTNTYPVFETGCSVYIDVEELCAVENLDCLVEPIKYHDDFKLDYILVADFTDLKKALKDNDGVETKKEKEQSLTEICEKHDVDNSFELDHILNLYGKIYEEWKLNSLSFDDRENLSTIGRGKDEYIGKYYYLYIALKEMEK